MKLQNNFIVELQLHRFEVLPGTKPGDNFASTVYRSKLNYSSKFDTQKDLSVIMKAIPENPLFQQENEENPLFKTEMQMYDGPLEAIQEVWKSVGDFSMLAPKYIANF